MKRNFFITTKQIKTILKMYGGIRKYELNADLTDQLGKIVLINKRNPIQWLLITQTKVGIVVEIANAGRAVMRQDIYKNKVFTMEDLSKVEFTEERAHLIECEEDPGKIDEEYMRIMEKYELWDV